MILTAFDPSKRSSGVAVFDGGRLINAFVVRARTVQEQVDQLGPIDKGDHSVIERPMIYPGPSNVRPNDIIDIAICAGACVNRQGTTLVLPSQWKGQAKKHITEARARKRLSASEISIVEAIRPKGMQEHAWDAVGIGLWWLAKNKKRGGS